MDYTARLEKLREKYPDEESQSVVSEWSKNLKLSSLTANLKEHDGMKIIVETFEKELVKIKEQLLGNPLLFKDNEGMYLGRLLHERKKWIEAFLKIFERAEKQIKGINKLIDEKLL